MKLRDFMPPAVVSLVAGLKKSFSGSVAGWLRGDDVMEGGPVAKLTSPYEQSSWVFAAVNLVSGEFTGLPVKFYAGDNEFTDPAFEAWWAAPGLGSDGKRLSRSMVDRLLAMWMQLEGEYFILLDDSWVVTAGRSAVKAASLPPFIIARPDRVRLIVQGGKLHGYEWTDAAGSRHVFVPEQVIHKMEPNPHDDWRGLGRQNVGRIAIESAFLTGVYIRNLMRNNGDQGFIVIGKSGPASSEQKEAIIADLNAKRRALRAGVAKDIFLGGGEISIERPKEESASVDLTNTKSLSHQEIFITFGVPPSMSTVKAAYSIGKDSDRYQLITGTSQPLSRTITGTYAQLAALQTGRALTCEHDWDDHPVMQEVRNSRLTAAKELWNTGWPWKAINEYLDLGMAPFPGWEIPYLPFSVAPLDLAAAHESNDPASDPALAEVAPVNEDDSVRAIRILLLARQRSRQCKNVTPPPGIDREFALFSCTHGEPTGGTSKARSEKEIAQWRTHMSQRREVLKSYQSGINRELMKARSETLRKIDSLYTENKKAAAVGGGTVAKAAAADLTFDLSKFKDALFGTLRNRSRDALQKAAKQLLAEIGSDDPFAYPPEEVLEFARLRENKLQGVPGEIHDKIKETIEEGLVKGDTQEQLAARVREAFNGISNGRARTIAATETSAAYGTGRARAMEKAGVTHKKWLTSGNDNVRDAHEEANGQIVPIDEPFEVGGEQLMFPGDSDGSAENVINCHCISLPTEAPDES